MENAKDNLFTWRITLKIRATNAVNLSDLISLAGEQINETSDTRIIEIVGELENE